MKLKSSLILILTLLMSITAHAYDFKSGGIYYKITDSSWKAVEVTYSSTYDIYSGKVVIPSSVSYNGDSYSVTAIGDSAFIQCISLTSVTIPSSVTSIGSDAFAYCSGLTSITIPEGVTSIGSSAFYGCRGLNTIIVKQGNPKYDSRDDCNAIIETDSNTLLWGCNTTTIPEGVTSIGRSAFRNCSGLTSVTIPESVTSIGSSAFAFCSGLTSVTIPEGVTTIGERAFQYCKSLPSVTIPNSVTSIGSYAFQECSNLTSIRIGNSVKIIGDYAFGWCSNLRSVIIPNSVTTIGERAFYDCDKLTIVIVQIEKPLVIHSKTFSNSAFAMLLVPNGCKAAYQAANYWKDFMEIRETTIPATDISLNTKAITLTSVGQTANLMATIIPSNTSNKNVTWASSNTAVATVSSSGVVTAMGYGTATITATTVDGSNLKAECTVLVMTPADATFCGNDSKISTVWYADRSMEPRSGLQEMHAVHYQPGNEDRGGDGTSVQDNKVFVFNLLSGFKNGTIHATTSDPRNLSTELTIVFDTKKYAEGITQTGISGKVYKMTATNEVVSATLNGETKPVVKLINKYKNKAGRWIEFQNNDFAKDLLNANPIFNADGTTTDAFYTEMTLADLKNPVPLNLSGDIDFRVRYLRPIDVAHVHSGKAYLKDAAEAGFDALYMADIFNFTDWRQIYPFGYNIDVLAREAWMDFYGIHDIYFNLNEIETDRDGIIEKLEDPNIILKHDYPKDKKDIYSNRSEFRKSIGYTHYQNNGGAVGSYNIFIPYHIVHNWGEVVIRVQVPIVGTYDDEKNIHWLDEEIKATGVQLSQTSWEFDAIGKTIQLSATVLPANATNRNVTWRSTNVAVATVNDKGFVTAVGVGTAQIIATTTDGSNITASCNVKVISPTVDITVIANDLTMMYGDDVPELTYRKEGGTLTGIPNLSTTATKTSDVGTYPIMVKAGSVTNSNVIYVDGTLTITQAPLTVTATSFTITQGDALPDFSATYSGFRNGNTASVLTKQPKFTCSATSSSAPGIYDIIVSEAEAKNYSITYVKGTLTIQEKTAETSSWYNDVIAEGIPVNNYTDETLDWGGWCFYTPEVRESGALPIVNGKLKTNNGTVYDINPAAKNSIVLRNANESKTFNFTTPCTCEDIYILAISTQGDASLNTVIQYEDGSTGTAQQFTISDWYSPQSGQGEVIYGLGRINLSDDSFDENNLFRLFEFKLSANKSKKATGITFTSTGSAIPTILGVTKGVTVTAEDKTMAFGDNVPELTYKVSGGTLTGRPNLSTTATKTSDVGTYPIMVKAGSVTNSNVIYVDGTLTVTQAPLTVTANSFTITQGDAMPAFTATYSGFRNGNTESVLTKKPKFTCSANSSSTPGTYDIIVSDAEAKNYSMNYVKGTLTVIKKGTTTPVEIADWPHDVIAENLPAGDYTDTALDNWDYVLYTSSAKASDALPIVNGLLTTGNETAYAIDPSKKNSLVLKATNTPRTLNFTTPAKCEEIRLIAISAEGAASVEAVVNYVDGTDAPVCQFTVDDWYNTESGHGEAVYGFDRINRSSNEFDLKPYFRIFEFTISTDADKIIKGITFTNTSSAIPTILGIAKKGYDAPVEMCTVTYAVRYDGKVVATATEKVAKGNTLPVAPASLTNDFVTLTKSGTHPTTVTKDVSVYFTATWNGPFEFSKTLSDAKWYNMHIRSGYYVSKTDSEPYYPKMADETERLEPAYLWAFGGDPYHVKVYNYTTGFAETLTKVGENAVVRKGDYTWDLLPNNGGFVLRVTGTENTCINQFGNNSGPLQFWTNGNSLTDDGSTFRVEDVTPLIDGIEFMGESDTSAPIYDLSGRRVSAPIKKGIFIINRKKVLVE